MSYNPKTATVIEKWRFRTELLKDYLDEIPFTSNQRRMIDHHLTELRGIFVEAYNSMPPESEVILDFSKGL